MRKEVCMFSKMGNFCFITKLQTTKNQERNVSKWKTLLSVCPFCLAKVRQIILAEKWFYRKVLRFFKVAILCIIFFPIRQIFFTACQQIFICSWKIFIQKFWTYIPSFWICVPSFWICVPNFWIHVLNFGTNIIYDKM